MKKIALIISVVLFSCGNEKEKSIDTLLEEGSIKELRVKKQEITALQNQYAEQLNTLNNRISELDSNKKIALVSSFIVQDTLFKHYIELQGNVNTNDLVVIYPELSGILTNIYVKEGQQVKKGEKLAKIDDGGLSQQLEQLKTQKALAKTTFERQERLWKQEIGSEIQYLQAKSNYEAQTQAVKQLQKMLSKTIVTAPFSGTIEEIITEQGNLVSPGTSPIIRIVNLNKMYIEADVPEQHITSVTANKTVIVNIPVLGETINASINQVGSYINPGNRTFKIQVLIPNKNNAIKPNLTAKLKINDYTNPKTLLIPQSIISENAKGEEYIYTIANKKGKIGVAKKTIITTGKTQGNVIEVISGITNNTEIILEGARSIRDGQAITISTH